uniref:Uncharacterized protein n=1 Tax=Aegilops tauschii subsp. strangulata TaxID=200361 RepID=A0A453I891_AEGTS
LCSTIKKPIFPETRKSKEQTERTPRSASPKPNEGEDHCCDLPFSFVFLPLSPPDAPSPSSLGFSGACSRLPSRPWTSTPNRPPRASPPRWTSRTR